MFKIDCFCEDRHLATVMRALAGVTKDLKVVPVINAQATRKGKVEAVEPGGMVNVLMARLKSVDTFNAGDVKAILTSVGRAPSSVNHYIADMVKHGMAKKVPGKHKNQMRYALVKK